ncbi:TPA: cysteine desulfurase [Candidatus Bathyarchaeota archaeon]|nr:cysteine desulfurase [Candidatus Bathyarchaeota archaeon]
MAESVEELIKAHEGLEREVYLDLENSSPVPEEVLEVMLPYFNKKAYGNPTLTHKLGWEAYEVIVKSAKKIAEFLGAKNPEEINFTPGETEANNLAIIGTVMEKRKEGDKIVISEIEPLNIIHVCNMLEKYEFKTEKVPVDKEGFVILEKLREKIDKNTVFASFSAVNNEIGSIQPIKEILEIVKDKNPNTIFHTDLSNAYGRIPFNVKDVPVDLATLSSYKILGPRGVGALYVKEGFRLQRIIEGQIGTQRLWPGVENTPAIVGFAKASELAFQNFEQNISHMKRLRDKLTDGILNNIDETLLNGPAGEKRSPDNINISFLKCEGEALTIELSLKGVYVSSGSACTRRALQPSHVLIAIGRKFEEAHGSILMKVTRYHTEEDINYVLKVIPEAVARLRKIYGSMGEI